MTTQETNQVKPLFALGQTLTTPGAIVVMQGMGITPNSILSRHQCGDWGDMDPDDKSANDSALNTETRIFSAYKFDTVLLWIITEADRSATTILLPEEY